MHEAIVAAVVAAAVIVRLAIRWGRRKGGSTPVERYGHPLEGSLGSTGLVAWREVRERMRGRVFRIVTVLTLAIVAAAIVIPVATRGRSGPVSVGVVGSLSAGQQAAVASAAKGVGTAVRLASEPDLSSARKDLRAGAVAAVVVDGGSLLVDKPLAVTDTSPSARLVRALAQTVGAENAFRAAGLSDAQARALAGARPLPVTSVQASSGRAEGNRSTSVIGLILVFVMLSQYNGWTLIGVMEEKASRVVEVLLAAVRPMQLLGGKVLGIGLVAFAQATLIVAFALALGAAVGSDLLRGTATVVMLATLLWLILGYAFYCWVYAAAGSLAERQDQIQTVALPLTLPMLLGYVTSLTVATTGNASGLFKVLAYLPPTAPFAMPVLVGVGAVTWWEFATSCLLSVAGTVLVARLAATIYRRAVLRTGGRVRLRDALSGKV
ncbi:MAG TPA: ABC transporter permease [Acidimicrobiales bacterium]|nr:ABC transporter permease [Acidimicrobiales bacterium]